jgi:hypothetical protein
MNFEHKDKLAEENESLLSGVSGKANVSMLFGAAKRGGR